MDVFLFWGEVERQDAYVLTDGVQVGLSKRVRRTGQDWSKYFPTYKSFNGISDKLWTHNHCHKEDCRSIASGANRHSPRACDVEVQG